MSVNSAHSKSLLYWWRWVALQPCSLAALLLGCRDARRGQMDSPRYRRLHCIGRALQASLRLLAKEWFRLCLDDFSIDDRSRPAQKS